MAWSKQRMLQCGWTPADIKAGLGWRVADNAALLAKNIIE
jgi:hypothetical protein